MARFRKMLERWEETVNSCKAETNDKAIVELKALLDHGAFYNFLTRDLALHLHLNIQPLKKKKKIHGYQGTDCAEEWVTEYAEFP